MGSLEAFYAGDFQGVWALLPVPAFFLVYLALGGARRARRSGLPQARFVVAYGALFGVLTLVDPITTGAVGRWLDAPAPIASAVAFLFVWVGDFRVFALVFRKNTTLKYLDLESNNLTHDGEEAGGVEDMIQALTTNTSLLSLNLGNNKLDDTIGRQFVDCLTHNKTLIDFEFGMN